MKQHASLTVDRQVLHQYMRQARPIWDRQELKSYRRNKSPTGPEKQQASQENQSLMREMLGAL